MPSPTRIAIVGSGAVGSYYGSRLLEAGCEVCILARSDLDALKKRGLLVRSGGAERRYDPVICCGDPAEIGPCDFVLVALKTTANAALPDLLPPLVGPDTAIVTLQNGLGNEEFLAGHFGAERVLGCLCFVCLNRVAPGVIEHYGHGSIAIGEFVGPVSPRVRALAGLFQSGGVDCEMVDELPKARWRKLVWNIPFNGLSIAAGGATVGELLGSPALEQEVRALMIEVIGAAGACGHALDAGLVEDQIARSLPMGGYKPSSLLDWLEGRPVEFDAIWAEPLRRAQAAGAEVPKLALLTALLGRLVSEVS